jgi:hypothetical protein
MGPRLSACILLLLLVAAVAPQAAAVVRFELHPRLRVEEEYNDNVFLRSDNQFADYVTTLYPGFIFAARTPSGGVELDYELGYSYYFDLGTDFTRHSVAFRGYQALSPKLNLEAVDTFYRYEELIEPGLGTLAPRPALLPYSRNTAAPRLTYSYGPESDIALTYTNFILDNDDPNLQDGFGNRVGFELRHALNRHNRLELGYSFERGEFEFVPTTRFLVIPDFNAHRANVGYTYELTRHFHLLGVYDFEDLTFLGGGVSDYRTHEGRAGFLYLLPAGWSATITGGYFRIDREGAEDSGGLAADVLVQKVLERGVGSVGFRRGLAEDFYSGENLGVYRYWLVGIGFTYFLRQHLNATLEATVGTRHFPLVARDDEFWSLETGLIYQLRKWLAAGIRYERYVLESRPGPFDFANNRYIATIGATY